MNTKSIEPHTDNRGRSYSNQTSGGLAVGPPHTGGGIKFKVGEKNIEVEGEEIAICASAYSSTKKYKLSGTPKEILKVIELDHGCNVGELTQLTGGEYIICKRVVKLDKKVQAEGTPKEIINYLQSLGGCKVENIKVDKPCDSGCDHEKKEDGGPILLAPNGKKSKLTPGQYSTVRTPQFKAWFGDWENDPENSSKVIDENGEPLVVYHGTTRDFKEFMAPNHFGSAKPRTIGGRSFIKKWIFFFSDDPEIAADYTTDKTIGKNGGGSIIPVFLNIRKVKRVNAEGSLWNEFTDKILNEYAENKVSGMIIKNVEDNFNEKKGQLSTVYVVFDKDENDLKIKSAISNTTFSKHNPDLSLEDGGRIQNHKYPFFSYVTLNQAISSLQDHPILTDEEFHFYQALYNDISSGKKYNRPGLEKLGAQHGITKFRSLKELAELAYVTLYRSVGMDPDLSVDEKYEQIQAIYNNQQNMNFGDQETLRLQQYSTPGPISYLMGQWCLDEKMKVVEPSVLRCYVGHIVIGHPTEYTIEFANGHVVKLPATDREQAIEMAKREYYSTLHSPDRINNIWSFEPSAGNGLLSVALNPEQTVVNELDPLRNKSLQIQGFANVWNEDASEPLDFLSGDFDIVLSNPPFGSTPAVEFGGFKITGLEQKMIIYALQKMKVDGRAAFIIGGHTKYDHKGRLVGRDKDFFQFLIKNYQLLDVINVDGSLYAKQGTTVPIRIILISGKISSDLNYPLYKDNQSSMERLSPQIIYNFRDLKKRIYGEGKIID